MWPQHNMLTTLIIAVDCQHFQLHQHLSSPAHSHISQSFTLLLTTLDLLLWIFIAAALTQVPINEHEWILTKIFHFTLGCLSTHSLFIIQLNFASNCNLTNQRTLMHQTYLRTTSWDDQRRGKWIICSQAILLSLASPCQWHEMSGGQDKTFAICYHHLTSETSHIWIHCKKRD